MPPDVDRFNLFDDPLIVEGLIAAEVDEALLLADFVAAVIDADEIIDLDGIAGFGVEDINAPQAVDLTGKALGVDVGYIHLLGEYFCIAAGHQTGQNQCDQK